MARGVSCYSTAQAWIMKVILYSRYANECSSANHLVDTHLVSPCEDPLIPQCFLHINSFVFRGRWRKGTGDRGPPRLGEIQTVEGGEAAAAGQRPTTVDRSRCPLRELERPSMCLDSAWTQHLLALRVLGSLYVPTTQLCFINSQQMAAKSCFQDLFKQLFRFYTLLLLWR